VHHTLIVGAGVFGLTAAHSLLQRGQRVTVLDPGPLPHPLAASTDISKAVRMDYGADAFYTGLAERAIAGWHTWNRTFGERLYHEVGFLALTSEPMRAGEFEFESWTLVGERGWKPERLQGEQIGQRFPAFAAHALRDGYLNRVGGYAESGRTIEVLCAAVQAAGAELVAGARAQRLISADDGIHGVVCADGSRYEADTVLVAAGAWTTVLLPHLADRLRPVAQPVLWFDVKDPRFHPPQLAVWGCDIARTGWYGFPALANGTFKVASHGPGRELQPDDERIVGRDEEARFRAFLADTFPTVANAPLLHQKLCLYSDSFDGHFLIDRDPEHPGLVVAAGGSGHAFKFAPVIGDIIADVVEGRPAQDATPFGWRERGAPQSEAARYSGRSVAPDEA